MYYSLDLTTDIHTRITEIFYHLHIFRAARWFLWPEAMTDVSWQVWIVYPSIWFLPKFKDLPANNSK